MAPFRHDGACRVWTCLWMETTSIFFNESAFPFPEILNHGLLFEVDLNPQRTGHSVICERDGPVTGFTDKLTTLQPISHPPFSAMFLRAWLKITFLSLKLKMTLSLMASSLSGNITEPSYSNEIYDSVSLKALDGFQNALHSKHIFIFGEGLITNMSLDITIYSTVLINLSFFMHCFFHNTNYHSSESCS